MRTVNNYDSIETIYYNTHIVSRILRVPPSKVRYWLDFFSINHVVRPNNRRMTAAAVNLLIEIKRLIEIEMYTLSGVKRQLHIKYGRKYERFYNAPQSPIVLGELLNGNGEKPPSEDILAPDSENKVRDS